MRRLGSDFFNEGWEKDAGFTGSISLLDWPNLSEADQKKFKKQLQEKQDKKIPLGFVAPKED